MRLGWMHVLRIINFETQQEIEAKMEGGQTLACEAAHACKKFFCLRMRMPLTNVLN